MLSVPRLYRSGNLRSTSTSTWSLQWDPSTDDYGPIRYDIYGRKRWQYVLAGSTGTTTHGNQVGRRTSADLITPEMPIPLVPDEVDGSDNESAQSNEVTVTESSWPCLVGASCQTHHR